MVDEKALEQAARAYCLSVDVDPDVPHALVSGAPLWWTVEAPHVRAAITAYLQALSPGSTGETEGWRDIKSAPKDFVTDVDLWANGERYPDCSWMRPTYGPKEYAWCRHAYDDSNGPYITRSRTPPTGALSPLLRAPCSLRRGNGDMGARAICTYVDAHTGAEWGRYDAGLFGWPDAAALRKRLRETCQFWADDVFIDLNSTPNTQTVNVIQIVTGNSAPVQADLFAAMEAA